MASVRKRAAVRCEGKKLALYIDKYMYASVSRRPVGRQRPVVSRRFPHSTQRGRKEERGRERKRWNVSDGAGIKYDDDAEVRRPEGEGETTEGES